MYGICMCINITNIFMSLYKCVYFHLFENIIFNLNLFQRLHQQLSRCCCSKRSTKLAATADLPANFGRNIKNKWTKSWFRPQTDDLHFYVTLE